MYESPGVCLSFEYDDILSERICNKILFDDLHKDKDMSNISHSTEYFTSL